MSRIKDIRNKVNQRGYLLPKDCDFLFLLRIAEAAEKFIYHDGPPIPLMPQEAGCAFIDLKNALKGDDCE